MPHTRIKICGIKDPAAARAAARAGADYIGLVFVPSSPRALTLEQALPILAALQPYPSVQPIGLFVDAPLALVQKTAQALRLDVIQLHGREDADYMQALAPLGIIKAVSFTLQMTALAPLPRPANQIAVLLDAAQGGSGQTIDWEKVGDLLSLPDDHRLPVFLAGGLNPSNVAQAIRTVRPYAVDVSSGVEAARGVKDAEKIQAFCQAVRQADER